MHCNKDGNNRRKIIKSLPRTRDVFEAKAVTNQERIYWRFRSESRLISVLLLPEELQIGLQDVINCHQYKYILSTSNMNDFFLFFFQIHMAHIQATAPFDSGAGRESTTELPPIIQIVAEWRHCIHGPWGTIGSTALRLRLSSILNTYILQLASIISTCSWKTYSPKQQVL